MESDLNLELLDRFRRVRRQMQTGWIPEDMQFNDKDLQPLVGDLTAGNCVRLFKREMILATLMQQDHGMNQREIAGEMGVSPSTISEMINRLVEDGYAERRQDPADRRAKILVLTAEGRILGEKILEECAGVLAFLFRNLDPQEKKDLIRLLDKLLV